MSQFNATKWFKNQYLKEANLNEKLEDQKVLKEEQSKNDRIFNLFYNELEDFDGVADYLTRYKKHIMGRLDSIDFDYLPKPSMMEEGEGTTLNLSQADMDKLHKNGKLEIDGHKILYKVEESLNEAEDLISKLKADPDNQYVTFEDKGDKIRVRGRQGALNDFILKYEDQDLGQYKLFTTDDDDTGLYVSLSKK